MNDLVTFVLVILTMLYIGMGATVFIYLIEEFAGDPMMKWWLWLLLFIACALWPLVMPVLWIYDAIKAVRADARRNLIHPPTGCDISHRPNPTHNPEMRDQ